uniref:Uncharacterized protein n=1 Tax=Cannabis sativa TaxID=3483 RepID=A0A803R5R8_CANSA
MNFKAKGTKSSLSFSSSLSLLSLNSLVWDSATISLTDHDTRSVSHPIFIFISWHMVQKFWAFVCMIAILCL